MKRAALSFDTVKARKAPQEASGADLDPSAASDTPKAAKGLPEPSLSPRGRGRPPKRAPGRTFGLTVRIDSDLRRQLRRLAEDESDRRGRIVSLNDLILEAVGELLERQGRA
jgi:hypothetical protein